MRVHLAPLLLLLLLLGVACSRDAGPESDPRPSRMVPARGEREAPVPVRIEGENFQPLVIQQLSGGEPARVDNRFQAFLGDTALEEVEWVDATALRARVPAGLAPGHYALTVVSPLGRRVRMEDAFVVEVGTFAQLVPSVSVERTELLVGQEVQLSLTLTNPGLTSVRDLVADVRAEGPAEVVAPGEPLPAELVPGGSLLRRWRVRGVAQGALVLRFTVTGTDAKSGVALTPSLSAQSLQVYTPAALVAQGALSMQRVSLEQELDASLTVLNTGGSTALAVAPELLLSAPGALDVLEAPTPQDIPGGALHTFRWRLRASTAGALDVTLQARGTEALTGAELPTGSTPAGALVIERPPVLLGHIAMPAQVSVGQPFLATLTVENAGEAAALAVAPQPPSLSGTGAATLSAGPSPASVTLPGGGTQVFSWQYTATTEGSLTLSGSATGTDANSGAPLASAASSSTSTVIRQATEVANDPFGDGTRFSYVFKYDEHVYLGPNKNGTGGVRTLPDGSGAQSFSFTFPKDVVGHYSASTASAPFPSIGHPGCAINTSDCGPDNETGRGLFFSGTLNGQEWLTVTGTKAQDWNYLEMTTDKDSVLDFRYVDMNIFVGGQARGLSSARVYANNIYLGVPDTTGNRPGIVVLRRTPDTAPGLDVPNDGSAQDLDLDTFEYFGGNTVLGSKANPASLVMIDAMAEFNGKLYLANNGGCVRTTTSSPRPYGNNPSDWATCRPTLAAYTGLTSITLSSADNLEPADRAVPQLVPFGGRLYMARNTTAGPQLLACSPGTSGSATDCDAGDWALVAPNTSGDARLTQFNTPGNTRITLLAATSAHLYVGFNNAANGLVLFRTSNPTASTRADFHGLLECTADQAPASCQGLGQNGLGVGATRIFDGTALTFSGTDYLYLTAGTGTSAVRVFRIVD